MKGALPWFVRWIRRPGTRDFYALDALVSKVHRNFSLALYYFSLRVLIALGRQSGMATSL
jgi:hypothetical protein